MEGGRERGREEQGSRGVVNIEQDTSTCPPLRTPRLPLPPPTSPYLPLPPPTFPYLPLPPPTSPVVGSPLRSP